MTQLEQMEKIKRISKIIKERFPNLTVDDTIDIAFKILLALGEET